MVRPEFADILKTTQACPYPGLSNLPLEGLDEIIEALKEFKEES